jgi:non-ribosomal peptide synthetase component F
MRPDQVERICRLTPLQDGMFFEALRKQGTGETIYQLCLRLEGPLSPSLLREAWRAVLRRHPILRTSFHYERLDLPVQVAVKAAEPEWVELDWRGTPAGKIEERLSGMLEADRSRPFELTRAPLMRLAVVQVGDDDWWMVWSYHHMLLDGWSTYLVLDDVFGWYRELSAGRVPERPAPRPFWEYVAWTQQQDLAKAEGFWRDRLAGFTTPTPISNEAVERPDGSCEEFGEVHATLPPELFAGLESLAKSRRITMGTVVQAAWALTLARYTRQDDVVFGSVVSGRPPEFASVDDMVGLFINVLPVRARMSDDVPLLDWIGELQAHLADGREYEYSPLSHIQRWSEVPRGAALIESLVVYINYPVRETWTDGGKVKVADLRVLQQPHYPLHLTVVPDQRHLRMALGYDPSRFRRSTAERIRDLVVEILTVAVTDPQRRIGDLPGGPPPDAPSLLPESGAPSAERTLPELLADRCARTPDAPAVAGGVTLTYRELDRRAERVADRLRDSGGGPGVPVAVVLERSADLAVGLLAVVKAGGTILPVDPGEGIEWIETAVAAAGARIALCAGTGTELLAAVDGLSLVRVDEPQPEASTSGASADPSDVPAAARLALLGHDVDEPAASLIRGDALARLLRWMGEHLPLSGTDRVAYLRSPGSAEAVRDVFWALASGAELIFPPAGGEPDPTVAIATVAVTSGPAAVVTAALRQCRGLRLVVASGPLPTADRRELAAATGADVVEEYRFAQPVPRSTFWFAATGDLVPAPPVTRRRAHDRVLPSGGSTAIWAVEAVLAAHPDVRDAAAVLTADPSGDQRLLAYVVPGPQVGPGAFDPTRLEEFLAGRLPARWTPTTFVELAELPTTEEGDLDRAALPDPSDGGRGDGVPVGSPIAVTIEVLTGIWAQLFDRVPGTGDNFFDLGGHSLLAIKLVSRIRSALGVDFTLNDLFADPTVVGTARAVVAALRSGKTFEPEASIPRHDRSGPIPASFAQERLWILDRLGGAADLDNILLPVRVRGPLDVAAFRGALAHVVKRHETLRTRLGELDGRPVQIVQESVELPLSVSDLSHLPLPKAEKRARELLEEDRAQRFDLSVAPLFRVRVVQLDADDFVFGICLHHVSIDGWSTGVLFRDLSSQYQRLVSGHGTAPAPLTAQYADYAAWQRGRLSGELLDGLLSYWTEHLKGAPEVLELQPGRPRPAERSYVGGRFDVDIVPDTARIARSLARDEGNTLFMVLFAAFAVLVARHTDRRDIVIGVPVAGRSHPDLENLVGFFVNTLPLRLDLSGEPTFRDLLKHVRRVHLGALAHEDLPFERLVNELGAERSSDRFPLVQMAFNFQNTPFETPLFGEAEATLFETDHEVARFDLVAELFEADGGVHCMFHYSVDLFDAGFVRGLAGEYLDLVRRLVGEPDEPVFAVPNGDSGLSAETQQTLDSTSRNRLRALQRQG